MSRSSGTAHLGGPPCYLLTATGRLLARTPAAPYLPAQQAARDLRTAAAGTSLRIDGDGGPYDSWYLHLRGTADAPPRVLHAIAEVFAQYRHHSERQRADRRRAADALVTLLAAGPADGAALQAALPACGLPTDGPYRVVVATLGGDEPEGAVRALTEALRHEPGVPFAAGRLPGGEAVAVVHAGSEAPAEAASGAEPDPDPDARPDSGPGGSLADRWLALHTCRPQAPLHAGVSAPVSAAGGLGSALDQARYALAAARAQAPDGAQVRSVAELSTLGALLAGVPADVRRAFSNRVLGPLAHGGSASHRMLLETLEVFLAHHGSWARTAEALHLHVNTVHYRIQRIETLTGRDLSRLGDTLDLRAALWCR
ncbi:helix-turn-helix domain-containing protein [Streptomyces sp. NPDC020742]|uniref:PucR family transcriptional regulator n=1 Tax=Streptomyces sp. NPDC020742 TaxID=3154897 RepID=UPI0033D213AF